MDELFSPSRVLIQLFPEGTLEKMLVPDSALFVFPKELKVFKELFTKVTHSILMHYFQNHSIGQEVKCVFLDLFYAHLQEKILLIFDFSSQINIYPMPK